MNIKHNRIILSVALLCMLIGNNVTVHSTSSPVNNEDRITNIQVDLRKKYSDHRALKFYGISYQQLQSMIMETSETLLRQARHSSRWNRAEWLQFEINLEKEVFYKLQRQAREHHAQKALSDYALRKRIEAHEQKLIYQYGKNDQTDYYKVSYQEVVDIIREVSRSMFGSYDNSMDTTESQLADLFRIHTDTVLEKLRARRDARS